MAQSSAPPALPGPGRRWLPRRFAVRATLILILPVVVLQLAVAIMFLLRHYEDVTAQMTGNMLREIALVRARPEIAPLLEIELLEGPVETRRGPFDLSGRILTERLLREPGVAGVDLLAARRLVLLGFEDGSAMRFSRRSVTAANPHQLPVLMVLVGVLMTLVSLLFLRGQLRSVTRLAQAAEAFGRGESLPYRPSGALEVRAAGTAFLDMRMRIERHIEQRTLLLSGVSHDLRTPLTRMRLELAMMDGPEARALSRDVAAMERIIDAFLDFAREDATDARVEVEVTALVREAAEMAAAARGEGEAACDVEVTGPETRAALYEGGMRRAVANLVGNACSYGTRVRVTVGGGAATLVIAVEDDGPGIAPEDRARAVEPFARLDAARRGAEGNVGLGLAIARDVARAHGGALRLGESALGGLKAELALPR
jgi:two-component system osmolarity sensor histidine kinase EnvZ